MPPGYPAYGGYPGYGGGFAYPVPQPPVVRHTLHTRRTWIWVVAVTAVVAGLVGGLVGAVGAGRQQTVGEKFFPNKSVLVRPSTP
jgi:hypothetical protein